MVVRNNDGIRGVALLVKEELCEKVIEVRRKSGRLMAMVLVFEEKVIRVICAYAPQVKTRVRERSIL